MLTEYKGEKPGAKKSISLNFEVITLKTHISARYLLYEDIKTIKLSKIVLNNRKQPTSKQKKCMCAACFV